MIGLFIAAMTVQAQPAIQTKAPDRAFEGDWFVSDDTDNNTGERNVSAMNLYLKKGEPDYITLRMRCSKGKPTFFVEWENLTFPDQTVFTIGPVASPGAEPAEKPYMFEKSNDVLENGYRASPDTSANIVSAIAQAKYATLTAHLTSGSRIVGLDVEGTQRAWSRVVRHCPIQIMPRPPQ